MILFVDLLNTIIQSFIVSYFPYYLSFNNENDRISKKHFVISIIGIFYHIEDDEDSLNICLPFASAFSTLPAFARIAHSAKYTECSSFRHLCTGRNFSHIN